MKCVDVIIPTYKPDQKFFQLLHRLDRQSLPPQKIIVINTGKEFFDEEAVDALHLQTPVEVHHIEVDKFDHGQTRNQAVKYSHAPYFICMTQDALPANQKLIEHLLAPMDEEVKLVYARQVPNQDAGHIERYTRQYNYPKKSQMKSEKTKEIYGIKNYFASNVCAAYERESFVEIGGFVPKTILNEDMLYAAALMKKGKKVCYCADAIVFHSHEYSGLCQFSRNFDIAVSQVQYKDVFAGLKSEKEGIRLVLETAKHLFKIGQAKEIPRLVYISGCKYLGFFMGKHYEKLPKWLVKKCSSNKKYWEKKDV